jgi:hypothetical protein
MLPANSPWLPNRQLNPFTSVPTEHSKIKNTLPLSEVEKYYPHGFPPDMMGDYTYTRLPAAEHQKNIGVIGQPHMTEEDIKRKQQDQWWYSGVRKVNRTIDENLRHLEQIHSANPKPPASPPPTTDMKKLSIKDLQEMSEPDVAKPILGAVFGTMLGYADQNLGPNNKSSMSKFTPAAPWQIDNSEKGNQSFFGEDWGPPPKRLGRDPRYQPFE